MPRHTRPRGLLRLFFRCPVLLYRAGLGWLLDDRFLMMTHIGRRSGHPHRVVLEVVQHDRQTDTYVIASGWGEGAHWVRNIEQTPEVAVQVGLRKWPARAERLHAKQAEAALADYARRNPVAFRGLAKWYRLEPTGSATLEQTWPQLSEIIPLFALHPRTR